MHETLKILSPKQVAELVTDSDLIPGSIQEHHVRRLYERGDLPEPAKLQGMRAIPRESLPAIIEACRKRAWLPIPALEPVA